MQIQTRPGDIIRLTDSPVQKVLRVLEDLFAAAPQPRVPTETAKACGELLGRHLLNLLAASGELNLHGLHSAAVVLFRPLEDALDCFAAVSLVAGAADRWLAGKLTPSDAAKLWVGRTSVTPITGDTLSDYRRKLRCTFNPLAHCDPVVAHWDVILDSDQLQPGLVRMRVNHERRVILSNAHRVDAYFVAHCWEVLAVVELAYSEYFETHTETKADLESNKVEYGSLLKEHFRLGLLESVQPLELEQLGASLAQPKEWIPSNERWQGTWQCGDRAHLKGVLMLRQRGPALVGTLNTQERAGDIVHRVTEELSGVRVGDRLLLDGVSAQVTPVADDVEYNLDSFDLLISQDETELKGRHSCARGQGEAVFRPART